MKHKPLTPVEKRHLFDVYKLSIFIYCVWFFERGEVDDFYERRKIDYLDFFRQREILSRTI
jgi:homoserine kinase type II